MHKHSSPTSGKKGIVVVYTYVFLLDCAPFPRVIPGTVFGQEGLALHPYPLNSWVQS